MTSALTPHGSTTAWRRLRTHHQAILTTAWTTGTTIECRICHAPITPGQAWDLGHATPRARGGDDTNLAPEHAHCNRAKDANTRHIPTFTHPDFSETGAANS
ncbi:MAG TPA: hypothetical protein VH912_24240, partial [Streptosporangiaceae bacterium]